MSFKRKLMTSHVLSDGILLPQGTIISMASGPMAVSSRYHSSPDAFDGLRFHRMRQDSKSSNAHHLTTTGLGSLMFGHGKYACPGRFFAALESKLVLMHVLLYYDLKLPDGTQRPKNLFFADANIPDPTSKILFMEKTNGLAESYEATLDRV